jgi:hypothetical protein
MDSELVQRTRNQLEARVRTTMRCPPSLFSNTCKHLLDWIEAHVVLRHLLSPLRPKIVEFETRISNGLSNLKTQKGAVIAGPWNTASREEAAALGWAGLSIVVKDTQVTKTASWAVAQAVGGLEPTGELEPLRYESMPREIVRALRATAIPDIYDYLDEQIDTRNVVLGLLLKYKTRCEWYRRDRLRAAAADGLEGRKSERALAFDLYGYLHDQGVDFAIESVTASGEPDLVASDLGGQRLVADAKYVTDDRKLAETMASGFRQVLQYCRDTSEPVGYLVVFLNCEATPDVRGERDDGFPCFRLGGITIYYVVVDIRERTDTASKLPKPRVVAITSDRLVSMIDQASSTS